ncbi:hypothetical protein VCSRO58_0535 [Vibrio cholerae]|nr:hypothetical protein VCSRO58_0535 [Vibrio cholerae]
MLTQTIMHKGGDFPPFSFVPRSVKYKPEHELHD